MGRSVPQRRVVPRSIKSISDSTIKKKKNQWNWINVAQEAYVLENYHNEADENCEQKH